MGCSSSAKALFLVCLLALGCSAGNVDSDTVDSDTLARIIQFFDDHYKKVNEQGQVHQYAVAINVPKEQCEKGFKPTQENFLTKEDAENNIKNKIYDPKVALYEGQELIAAGVLQRPKHKRHSEAILMNPPETSPLTNLLNKRQDGCVVFYTYNSPCVNTCININGKYSILGMLEKWRERSGLKAFVFKRIWKDDDKRKDMNEKFRAITNYVPLYCCGSDQTCHRCDEPDGNIRNNCLPNL